MSDCGMHSGIVNGSTVHATHIRWAPWLFAAIRSNARALRANVVLELDGRQLSFLSDNDDVPWPLGACVLMRALTRERGMDRDLTVPAPLRGFDRAFDASLELRFVHGAKLEHDVCPCQAGIIDNDDVPAFAPYDLQL